MNKNRSLFQQLFYLAINNLLCLLCLSVVADQHPADQSVETTMWGFSPDRNLVSAEINLPCWH